MNIYRGPEFDSRQFLFFSCVYQELINGKSKYKKKMLLFVLYCPGPHIYL